MRIHFINLYESLMHFHSYKSKDVRNLMRIYSYESIEWIHPIYPMYTQKSTISRARLFHVAQET